MAKRSEENQDLGTSAPTEGGAADAVATNQDKAASGKVADGEYRVNFNRSTGVSVFVLADGTEVADGELVSNDVFKKLADEKLDGYDLLIKEDS